MIDNNKDYLEKIEVLCIFFGPKHNWFIYTKRKNFFIHKMGEMNGYDAVFKTRKKIEEYSFSSTQIFSNF